MHHVFSCLLCHCASLKSRWVGLDSFRLYAVWMQDLVGDTQDIIDGLV